MKLQYISCHAVLEYDEVKLLSELGINVNSNGCYRDPRGAYTLPRPAIESLKFDQKFFDSTAKYPKTNLPPELIEPYDVFVIMAGDGEKPLTCNWDRIKHKRVIWRSIGQNTPNTERMLQRYVKEGLEIVRYSPKERGYENYAGEKALIRFYKDENEFSGWVGDEKKVINFTQSLKGRGGFVHYDEIMGAMAGFDGLVYGSGNNDLGVFNGGELTYEDMKDKLRHSRVLVYAGTWPACYTLTIIEAMMTGIPVVAISKQLAYNSSNEKFDFYEVDEIIKHKENGFICNNIQEMRKYVELMLNDYELAKKISENGRKTAIETWGKEKIKEQWKKLLFNE